MSQTIADTSDVDPVIPSPPADLLFATPDNPPPLRVTAGMLTMKDGKRLRYGLFRTSDRHKGTVLLLTGRNECIEKYFETVRDLNAMGLTVVVFDWRGQGNSDRLHKDRQRGHIQSFDQYVDDLDVVFQEVLLPDCRGPYFVLAHSTGALIALLAAPRLVNRVRRMVLVAPLLTMMGYRIAMPAIGRLSRFLYRLGLGGRYLGSGPRPKVTAPFEGNRVTSDPLRYLRNVGIYEAHPELALGGPTVAWVRAAWLAARRVQEQSFVERMHIPTLFIAAGADSIVSTPTIEHYARRMRSASSVTIDGARHEILQERDIFRNQLLGAFAEFVPGTGADLEM